MNNKELYLVYKTTNKLNSKIYIGVHKTSDLNRDTYYGSGVYFLAALNKHGKWNFDREILFLYHSRDVAYKRESYIVNKEFIEREDTYNIKLGGSGGWDHCHNEYIRAKINKTNSVKHGNNAGFMGTQESRDIQRSNHEILYGNKYWNIHKPESRIKVTQANISSGHYDKICYNSPESLEKRASTFHRKAINKYPILGTQYNLLDPDLNIVLSSNLLDICIYLFTNRLAVKRYDRLFENGIPRVIKRGKWKGFVVNKIEERSTTSA